MNEVLWGVYCGFSCGVYSIVQLIYWAIHVKFKHRIKLVENPKMNFVNALSYIFHVSKLFGLIPYSLTDYSEHKILKTSIVGNIQSLLCLVGYVVFYHFTVAKTYFDRATFDSGNW